MENKQLKENKQLIEELENAFGDGFSFNLDEINPDEYASNSFSKESDDGVCSTAHPSLMSILEKNCRRARIAKNRELFCKYNIQRRKCFSIAYNFKSQSFSKAVYISKRECSFRFRSISLF